MNTQLENKAVYRQYRRHSSQGTDEQYSLLDLVEIRGLLRSAKHWLQEGIFHMFDKLKSVVPDETNWVKIIPI